jgi:hypothetical protein
VNPGIVVAVRILVRCHVLVALHLLVGPCMSERMRGGKISRDIQMTEAAKANKKMRLEVSIKYKSLRSIRRPEKDIRID